MLGDLSTSELLAYLPKQDLFLVSADVAGLRRAGHQQYLPLGLLTLAWLRSLTGARTGTEWSWGTVRVQPTLGGYVYSDVDVETIHTYGFFFTLPTDKGYLWVKGTGKLNVQWTDKFSTSIEGEARHRPRVTDQAESSHFCPRRVRERPKQPRDRAP